MTLRQLSTRSVRNRERECIEDGEEREIRIGEIDARTGDDTALRVSSANGRTREECFEARAAMTSDALYIRVFYYMSGE